jgi:hypothetical protein
LEMNIDYENNVLWFLVMEYDQMPQNPLSGDLIPISEADFDALVGRIINHIFMENKLAKASFVRQYLLRVGALRVHQSVKSPEIENSKSILKRFIKDWIFLTRKLQKVKQFRIFMNRKKKPRISP